MKPKFWVFLLLIIIGAVSAGFGSGMYSGRKEGEESARTFLRQFRTETEVDRFLDQKGQGNWSMRLELYGESGPDSYVRAGRKWVRVTTFGLCILLLGLVSLLRLIFSKS